MAEKVTDKRSEPTSVEEAVALLAQIVAAQQQATPGLSAADMKEILETQRQALNPSNPTHPGISVFSHPEGDRARPKADLDRETFFCGSRQREEQLTPDEIAAFNELQESCAMPERGDFWFVKVTPRRREVVVPAATRDQLMDLPQGLALILRMFKHGAKAVDPLELAKELRKAQEKILELEERMTAPGV